MLLPILSFFNCIMNHRILYHIFNHPDVAKCDAQVRRTDTSYTHEPAKGYKENYDFFLCVLYVAKSSCFSHKGGA